MAGMDSGIAAFHGGMGGWTALCRYSLSQVRP